MESRHQQWLVFVNHPCITIVNCITHWQRQIRRIAEVVACHFPDTFTNSKCTIAQQNWIRNRVFWICACPMMALPETCPSMHTRWKWLVPCQQKLQHPLPQLVVTTMLPICIPYLPVRNLQICISFAMMVASITFTSAYFLRIAPICPNWLLPMQQLGNVPMFPHPWCHSLFTTCTMVANHHSTPK